MRVQESPDYYRIHFDSWADAVDAAAAGPLTQAQARTAGGVAWETALRLAREGWPEGEAHVRRLSLDLFDRVSNLIERPVYLYDVEGADFDVSRVVDGEPECWQREEVRLSEAPGRRVLRLVYVSTASAAITNGILTARGAAAVALVELLEYAGLGVQVILAEGQAGYHSGPQRYETYTTVKEADQPTDMPRLAFALAHPASFRSVAWSIQDRTPLRIQRAYGFNGEGSATRGQGSKGFHTSDRGDIYVPGALSTERRWDDAATARAWIIETLKAQGVHLRDQADAEPAPAAPPQPQPHTVYLPVPGWRRRPYRRRRRW